ncbi:MAG: DUF547 domain-containing protein [Planctomycetes bacterium]|nr:DUF547 domain-containing protein [Planctomycetota bacterium]
MVVCVLMSGGTLGAQAAASFDQDHADWTEILASRVHDGGLVDYRGLRRDRRAFDAYLAALESVTAEDLQGWSAPQRQAFWINAYNAFAAQLVLDHAPEESIRELGELEHDILAKQSGTPLFHFAAVCASTSCPALRPAAYTGAELDRQLEARARLFLADPAKNDPRVVGGRLPVSKIFDWAEDEWGQYPGGVRAILREFGPASWTEDAAFAAARLKYRSYDWSLNRWSPKDSTP